MLTNLLPRGSVFTSTKLTLFFCSRMTLTIIIDVKVSPLVIRLEYPTPVKTLPVYLLDDMIIPPMICLTLKETVKKSDGRT